MYAEQLNIADLEMAFNLGLETTVEPLQLGKCMRAIRQNMNLALEEASQNTSLACFTLSKTNKSHRLSQ